MAKTFRKQTTEFRIRIGALASTEPGRALFENEFFDKLPRGIEVWSGVAWVEKPIKVWVGSIWVEKPIKVWDGSSWQ